MRVLCAGDLHLGRRASRVPGSLDSKRFSCAAGWDAIVRTAHNEQVDLVALSGDLVDKDNRYFEAFGPLERGLTNLLNAGITVVAVAGNHDYHVLPRLADSFKGKGFHLLGRNGEWERFELVKDGRASLYVDGWSFTRERVLQSPLADYRLPASEGIPILGLLHADLDQAQSHYAPVLMTDLRRKSVSMWLLGHIHAPKLSVDPAGACVLYPGSPVAMDPGEPGLHGVWLVEFNSGSSVSPRQIPLSPIRYVRLDIDISSAEDRSSFEDIVTRAVNDSVRENLDAHMNDPVELLCYRVCLTGRSRAHRQIESWAATLPDLDPSTSRVSVCLDKVETALQPAFDYRQMAGTKGLTGELATLILALEGNQAIGSEYQALIASALERMDRIHRSSSFTLLSDEPSPNYSDARECVRREAVTLLSALVAQKEQI